MNIVFGSARIDEKGKLSGGKAGDNKQTAIDDYKGEVSMQTGYVHSKGWVIIRAKSDDLANQIAKGMKIACNNKHLGYDQGNRLGVITYGIETTTDTECDCSSLIRAILKWCGIIVDNFTTANAVTTIMKSGLFDKVTFTKLADVKTGDILCTKTKGHIVACTEGVARNTVTPVVDKPMVASPTIKKGIKGIHAKYLQQDLNYVLGLNLTTDGVVGAKTVEGIKAFQKKYGLTVDGSYGPASYKKMKELLG